LAILAWCPVSNGNFRKLIVIEHALVDAFKTACQKQGAGLGCQALGNALGEGFAAR